VEENKMMTTDT